LCFCQFELDFTSGELHKDGEKVALPPKAFEILRALAERPGDVVTREELRAQLWPADTFVEFDDNLNHAVNKLRQVLGDSVENPQFIETLPRYGYRFIAPVQRDYLPLPSGSEGKQQEHAAVRKMALRKPWVVAISATGLVVVLALLLGFDVVGLRDRMLRGLGVTREPPLRIQSIAVLPLENLSHDPEQEYFADGMTEELITTLGKISALHVISRTSVMRYKGTKKTLPEIARELNVDALVEGTVLRSDDRVRITANLLNARTDHHLWAESYERDLRDVMSLQDDVARAIAEAITVRLTPQERERLAGAPAVNPEAYRLYLEGRYQASKRTLIGLQKSILLFQQAIAKDPGFALAYAGLSESYGLLPFYGDAPSKEAFPKAKAAAVKAVGLDSSLAEAHAAMGFVLFYGDWNWLAAERELTSAIKLRPSFATSHHWYAEYLSAMGRPEEAVAEIKRAQELDPLSPLLFAIGGEIYFLARRYDEAIEQCQKALDLDPNYELALENIGGGLIEKRMYKEAAAKFAVADRVSGMSESPRQALAYAITGKRSEALTILRRLQEPSHRSELSSVMAAPLYLALGMKKELLDWLERAYEEHEAYAPFWNVNPDFDPLRSDPRFQHILRRMNFPP